jgi:catechol 2,3-dioxygenase-like lactoylglutathione lyase family enzyme
MIDHIGVAVSNMDRAKAFYEEALKPLGVGLVMEVSAEETGRRRACRLRRRQQGVFLDRHGR